MLEYFITLMFVCSDHSYNHNILHSFEINSNYPSIKTLIRFVVMGTEHLYVTSVIQLL